MRVRNVATVGGNLAHADPHLDLPPVWIALGAEAVIVGPGRERVVPVEDIFAGYYETTLAPRRPDRRAARADPAGVAHDLHQGHAALGARLAGARPRGVCRAAGPARHRRAHRAQRRDRPADAPRRGRSRAARRAASTRRRCGAPARPPPPKPRSNPTTAARPTTRSICCACISARAMQKLAGEQP